MRQQLPPPLLLATAGGGERRLPELETPLDLERLLPGDAPWEVELGFGKGAYLLRRAAAGERRRFLGIEMASPYFRRVRDRIVRRGLDTVLLLRGEAQYLLAVVLPAAFAAALHVYFPDPWPKARHHKRRLFDAESVDLVVSALAPGGTIFFATDHLEYGELVAELLAAYPGLEVGRREVPWEEGARTHYEARFLAAGRPIVRLEARLVGSPELHPAGRAGVVAATSQRGDEAGAA